MEDFWTINIATVLSGILVAVIVSTSVVYPLWRRHRLKQPYDALFFLQIGNDTHCFKKLVLPANSSVLVRFDCVPRLSYFEDEFVFGFAGDNANKPIVEKEQNPYVARAKDITKSPETHDDRYVDVDGMYHVQYLRQVHKGSEYSCGFVIKTKGPGKFSVEITSCHDGGEGETALQVEVMDKPSGKLKCVKASHKNCAIEIDERYLSSLSAPA